MEVIICFQRLSTHKEQMLMAKQQYVIDCSKFPSDANCDLKITASDKEAVIDTAYNHAIGPMHKKRPARNYVT